MKTERHAGSMRGTGRVSVMDLPKLIGPEAAAEIYMEMVLEAQETRNRRTAPVYRGNGLLEWSNGHTITLTGSDQKVLEVLVDASPRGVTRKALKANSGVGYVHRVLAGLVKTHDLLSPYIFFARGRGGTYRTTIRRE